jgi:very-short-patch-repair endonuclease
MGFKKGHIAWNKGIPMREEIKQQMIKNRIGKGLHPGIRSMKSPFPKTAYKKGVIRNSEQLKKMLNRREKSSLEIKFEQIITKLGLPYKFVGNGEVIVARKCPDFVDSNGKKIAIEVFYRRHKQLFRGGLEEWKAERLKVFINNGWKIIFFDETQVNENTVQSVLGN